MIKILDSQTAAKIAAGEVIETPVSVLKELIENSIDARSSDISIIVEKSGKKLIKVIDNGSGMSREDLLLSIHRYSTSKINRIDDITNLTTYGFRGEALFSIFSVSRLSITSYNGEGENGYKLYGEGGDFSTITITPAPPLKGTTVEVRDLFFNTPARYKFLKSDSQIRSSIINLFEEFALILPNNRLTLIIDGKEIYNLPPEKDKNIIHRAEKIIGKDLINNVIYFEESFENLKIKGFISNPFNLIPSKQVQYIYINNRIIESRTISSAIYKAFDDIRNGRHPVFLISVDIDPSRIDVNIHPQKKEVRFDDESFIYYAIYKKIKSIIDSSNPPELKFTTNSYQNKPLTGPGKDSSSLMDLIEIIKNKDQTLPQESFIKEEVEVKENYNPSFLPPSLRFIGQVFSSILIYQSEDSIILVDQHAAAERITFEKYIDQFNNNKIVVQKLIIPFEINLSKSRIARIMEMKDWLFQSGFEINQRGPQTLAVYSFPSVFNLSANDLADIFIYLSDIILKPENISSEIKRDAIATIACKKSIKFNQSINAEYALNLFEDLKKTKEYLRCPHGRPTMIEIKLDEILRRFGRNG